MAFIKMEAKLLKYNKKVEKKIKKIMEVQMRQAIRAFIRAAVPRIPVDTGMSRGSLMHLGRLLRVRVPIRAKKSRVVTVRGKRYKLDNSELRYEFSPGKGEIKDKDLGAALTKINSVPSDSIDKTNIMKITKDRYIFDLDASIFQLNLHGDRWGALEAGSAAFVNYLETKGLERFPHILEMILTADLKVDGTKRRQGSFKPVETSKRIRRD
jgi:hypothetical protein